MNKLSEIRLTIVPTLGCNMRCPYCYQANRGFPDDILPLQDAQKAFDIFADNAERITVILHGGEPTLCGTKYIADLFAYIRAAAIDHEIRVSFMIQTNGILLDEEMAESLKSFNTIVGVSYDGLHNKLLRGSSSELVLKNIKASQRLGLNITALCVETEKTFKDVILNYEWFKSQNLGFKILPLYGMKGIGNGIDEDSVKPTTYADCMVALYRHWLMDTECDILIPTLEGLLCLFTNTDAPCRMGGNCFGKNFAIMPNGDIGLCSHAFPEKYTFANVATLNCFQELIDSPGYLAICLLNKKRKQQLCAACEFLTICQGGCLANAFHDDAVWSIDGASCRRTRALLAQIKSMNASVLGEFQSRPLSFNTRAQEILSRVHKTKRR